MAITFPERKVWVGWALIGVVAAGAASGGWWFWRHRSQSRMMLRAFPAENALLLYLDVERLRSIQAFEPLLKGRVEPDPDYARFVKQTGFDYQKDLDAAAVCYLADRVYIIASGRFDSARLRRYAIAQGGSCAGSDLDRPCRIPASQPGKQISFLLLSSGVLGLATASEPDAALQLKNQPFPNAEPLADAAKTMNEAPAVVWATVSPASLERILSADNLVSPNLMLFAKALASTQRAYLFLSDRSPNLELSIRAICASDAHAAEVRRLVQGLNDLAGGLMQGARGSRPVTDWERVLGTGTITQEQNTVRASWTLNAKLLENLGTER